MNSVLQYQFFILLGILLVGFVITGWKIKTVSAKLNSLFGKSSSKDAPLQSELIARTSILESKTAEMDARLKTVEQISKISVQKVGFIRFNPFQDTGGDNSFVIALLDRQNSGVLLSSLYTREGVRVYAKQVIQGRTKNLLSGEEKKVLEETIRKNYES